MLGLTRSVLLGVTVWLAVVLVGSVLVWTVISRAGADVTTRDTALPLRTTAPADTPADTPRTPGRGATRPPRSSGTSGTSQADPTTPPQSPAPTTSSPTAPSPTAPPVGLPTVEQRTWSGAAGVVTAQCRGAAISLVGANPSTDGYIAEVKDRGPEELEVEFEGRGEEDGNETEVAARCQDGVPAFFVATDS